MNLRLKQLLVFITILIAFIGFTYAAIPNNTLQNDWLVVSNVNATNSYNIGTNTVIDNNREATFTNLTLSGDYLNGYNITEQLKYPQQPASYIIWTDGSTYYAKNGATNEITTNANITTLSNAIITLCLGGEIIEYKSGIYNLTAPIIDNEVDGITLKGQGDSTVFNIKTNKRIISLSDVDNWEILNILLNGNRTASNVQSVIYLDNCDWYKIHDLTVLEFFHAMTLYYSENGKIYNTVLRGGESNGIALDRAHYTQITDNKIYDTKHHGIDGSYTDWLLVNDNHLYTCDDGIYLAGSDYCIVSSNWIYDSQGDYGIYLNAGTQNLLIGNWLYMGTSVVDEDGIKLDGGCDDSVISNNLIKGAIRYGVTIESANSDNVTIANNKFLNCATPIRDLGTGTIIRDNEGVNDIGDVRLNAGNIEMWNSTAWVIIGP